MAARLGRTRPASAYIIHRRSTTPVVAADIAMQLNSVTMDFAGTPTPPSGDIAVQLNGVTVTFAATSAVGGDAAMQLSSVTTAIAGSVNPIGALAVQLNSVTVAFESETIPFGAHVIHVEAEKRGLRINRDDTITPIYPSEVTDA